MYTLDAGDLFRLPAFNRPMFLQCCPYWIIKQQSAIEVMDIAFWADKGNLNILFNSGNPMPVALKNAYRSFDAGYNEGIHEKSKSEQKNK